MYFKHVNSLPCIQRHNSSASMTCALFMYFLTYLERRKATKNWQILPFVDKCATHLKQTSKLRTVQVEFLLTNTTSVLQPMDKRTVRSLKHNIAGNSSASSCGESQPPKNAIKYLCLMPYPYLQNHEMLSAGKQL
jgi:hypothetical protein